MTHFILLAAWTGNVLAPVTSIPAQIATFMNFFVPYIVVPLVATFIFASGVRILIGKKIYKKTKDKEPLNKAVVASLYVMMGTFDILVGAVYYYIVCPWLTSQGNYGMIIISGIMIFVVLIVINKNVISGEKKKIYSRV
ncbi:MAG: hypothetical protein JWM20_88 [Patescibacteria group bacterium]|nr:hypothetical protein [Patescibacteria group bacterium]